VLEPARGGRLLVKLTGAGEAGRVAAICREARDRAWRAYRAVEAFASASGQCRRRTLLDHFGDARLGAPLGRCCDVCDPDTIGLPDPATLSVSRSRSGRPAGGPVETVAVDPADAPLLAALRAWRLQAAAGKPAYTVAHNRTLEAIAAQRPASLAALSAIRGIGPSFVERFGAEVLALVAGSV
jgi:superfamily II DNA helicase RecQ